MPPAAGNALKKPAPVLGNEKTVLASEAWPGYAHDECPERTVVTVQVEPDLTKHLAQPRTECEKVAIPTDSGDCVAILKFFLFFGQLLAAYTA
jgi:hypothetical protein